MKENKYNTRWIVDADKSRKVKLSMDAWASVTYNNMIATISIGCIQLIKVISKLMWKSMGNVHQIPKSKGMMPTDTTMMDKIHHYKKQQYTINL